MNDLFVLAFSVIIIVSGIYINLRHKAADNIQKEGNSLFWFRLLSPLALLFSLIFYFTGIASFEGSSLSYFVGILLLLSGLLLRWNAVVVLGSSFTVQVAVHDKQQLITNGVYKFIRHPSYTGLLMYNFGLGLIQQNWLSILVLSSLPMIATLNRIAYEEQVLLKHFGAQYLKYRMNTKRLIPFLY
jgi:protein-S-isoprenylcysteine O-methyltransferase Ste14